MLPSGDRPRDVGPALTAAVVTMLLIVGVALRILFLDIEQTGTPAPAPGVVVWTPTTYGPPPW